LNSWGVKESRELVGSEVLSRGAKVLAEALPATAERAVHILVMFLCCLFSSVEQDHKEIVVIGLS